MPAPQDPLPDEEAAWRAIVDNYGERALLDDEPVPRPEPRAVRPVEDEVDPEPPAVIEEEHYVPPPPPPLPRTEPGRMLAWAGVLGVPLVVLVLVGVSVLTHRPSPLWAVLLLMVWFVGGFVYLVASMRPGPRDDNDDGAVV